jgi:hypothetical protein
MKKIRSNFAANSRDCGLVYQSSIHANTHECSNVFVVRKPEC